MAVDGGPPEPASILSALPGHGGQLIVLLDELDMVIITTADPFFGQHDGNFWTHEKATINLVGEFIKYLPGE